MSFNQRRPLSKWMLLLLLAAAAALLIACDSDSSTSQSSSDDDDDDHDHEEVVTEELIEEACEHAADGPFEDITATDTADDAPSIAADHTAYVVALASGDNYVSFEADEETDFVFFLSVDATPDIADADEAEVEIEDSEDVSGTCDEIVVAHVAELEVGLHTLNIDGDAGSEVTIIVEEAEHDHEDE